MQVFAEASGTAGSHRRTRVLAYERVGRRRRTRGIHAPYWRSYFVSDEVELDGTAIANATGSYDPNTNRPVVLLDFDRKGGRTFGELTGADRRQEARDRRRRRGPVRAGHQQRDPRRPRVDHDGRQRSDAQERERDVLVADAARGALPLGGKVLDAALRPANDQRSRWSGSRACASRSSAACSPPRSAWLAVARPRGPSAARVPALHRHGARSGRACCGRSAASACCVGRHA